MKKIISIITLIVLTLTMLSSCINSGGGEKPEAVKLRIGYMAGPTGMGMAKLIADNGGLDGVSDKYSFTKYADTQAAKADLAAGNIDIICLPTNEAAVYFNTVDSEAKVLAINCLNSLYLLTKGTEKITSLADLEGQTVYTCKNGTPRTILEHIIKESGLNITVSYEFDGKEIHSPAALSELVVAGKLPNAMMPEPLVTSSLLAIAKAANPDISYTVDVNMEDEWDKVCDTPITMGCILADGDVARDYKHAVDAFLVEYKASVEYISNPANIGSASDYVVKTGISGAPAAAKKALTNLGDAISYLDGGDMKEALVAFYSALGIKLPNESFYYAK